MSFSYAEESAKPSVEALLDGFSAQTGLSVEPLGSAWGDMQKNIFLRARSKTLPSVAQLSERWLPTFANLAGLVDLNEVYGKENLEPIFAPDALAMGQIGGKQLALPLISGSIGLVANKAVLEKAGITKCRRRSTSSSTALIAVRDKVPNSVPYTMATKNNGSILLDFMIWNWTFGGEIIDAQGKVWSDSDAGKQALRLHGRPDEGPPRRSRNRPARCPPAGGAERVRLLSSTRRRPALSCAAFRARARPSTSMFCRCRRRCSNAGDEPDFDPVGAFAGLSSRLTQPPMPRTPAEQVLSYLTSDAAQTTFPLEQSALPVTKSARANPRSPATLISPPGPKDAGNPRRNEVGIWPNAAELTHIIGEEVQGALLGQKSADDAIKAMQTAPDRVDGQRQPSQLIRPLAMRSRAQPADLARPLPCRMMTMTDLAADDHASSPLSPGFARTPCAAGCKAGQRRMGMLMLLPAAIAFGARSSSIRSCRRWACRCSSIRSRRSGPRFIGLGNFARICCSDPESWQGSFVTTAIYVALHHHRHAGARPGLGADPQPAVSRAAACSARCRCCPGCCRAR